MRAQLAAAAEAAGGGAAEATRLREEFDLAAAAAAEREAALRGEVDAAAEARAAIDGELEAARREIAQLQKAAEAQREAAGVDTEGLEVSELLVANRLLQEAAEGHAAALGAAEAAAAAARGELRAVAASCITLAAELALSEDEREQHLAAMRYDHRAVVAAHEARALADLRVHAVRMRKLEASATLLRAMLLGGAADGADNVEALVAAAEAEEAALDDEQHSALDDLASARAAAKAAERAAQARKFGRANVESRDTAPRVAPTMTAVGAALAAAGVPLAALLDGGGVAAEVTAALPPPPGRRLQRQFTQQEELAVSRLQAHAKGRMTRADLEQIVRERYGGGDGGSSAPPITRRSRAFSKARADVTKAGLSAARLPPAGGAGRGVEEARLRKEERGAASRVEQQLTVKGVRELASNVSLDDRSRRAAGAAVSALRREAAALKGRVTAAFPGTKWEVAAGPVGWESDEAAAEAEATKEALRTLRALAPFIERGAAAAAAPAPAPSAPSEEVGTSPHASPRTMLGTVLAAADDVDGAVAALIARGREVAAADRAAGRPTTAPDWLLPRRTVTVGLPQVTYDASAEATSGGGARRRRKRRRAPAATLR